jgi:hypothetical protein
MIVLGEKLPKRLHKKDPCDKVVGKMGVKFEQNH